jgi:hypothetical protein
MVTLGCVVLFWIAVFGGLMMLARRLGRMRQRHRNALEPEVTFPKWWHGLFVMLVGTVLALLEGAGLLGLPRSESDIDKVIFLFLGGLLFGFVLLMWSQFNRR